MLEEQERARDGPSIKSQPDPDDLEDFVLTKAENVHCFGSPVGNKICETIDQCIPKNTQNETILEFQDLSFTYHVSFAISISYEIVVKASRT